MRVSYLFIIVNWVFAFIPFSNAEPFERKGEANFYKRDPVGARGRAIELALKNSVKETILTFVSDWILVLNHKLVDDEILSNYYYYVKFILTVDNTFVYSFGYETPRDRTIPVETGGLLD